MELNNNDVISNLPPQGPEEQAKLRDEQRTALKREERQQIVKKAFVDLLKRFRGDERGITVEKNVIGGTGKNFVEGTAPQSQQDKGSTTQVSEPPVTGGIKETHN